MPRKKPPFFAVDRNKVKQNTAGRQQQAANQSAQFYTKTG